MKFTFWRVSLDPFFPMKRSFNILFQSKRYTNITFSQIIPLLRFFRIIFHRKNWVNVIKPDYCLPLISKFSYYVDNKKESWQYNTTTYLAKKVMPSLFICQLLVVAIRFISFFCKKMFIFDKKFTVLKKKLFWKATLLSKFKLNHFFTKFLNQMKNQNLEKFQVNSKYRKTLGC